MDGPLFAFGTPLALATLSVLLLAGTLLRARVALLQRLLLPASLIGGTAGLIATNAGLPVAPCETLEELAYHLFNVSFIAMGLMGGAAAGTRRTVLRGGLWMALVQGLNFPLQALVGGLVVLGFAAFGVELFVTFGFLAPLGFNEGPGQAISFGKAWEAAGFAHGAVLGAGVAACGYLFAFLVGVPLVGIALRRLRVGRAGTLPADFLRGIRPHGAELPAAGRLRFHVENIDSLAFQAALIGLVYLLTYLLLSALASRLPEQAAPMAWGFFFFAGLLVAMVLRGALAAAGLAWLIDDELQRRVAGTAIDYLVVAVLASIQFELVGEYLWPFVTLALLSGLATTVAVVAVGSRLPEHRLARTAAIYGTVTGTVSSGLLLLRLADPEFRSPVALELAVMNLFSAPLIVLCTALVNAPLWGDWSLPLTLLAFAGIGAACGAGALWLSRRMGAP